jgi:hypothetical protein
MIDMIGGQRIAVIRHQSNIFFYLRQLVNKGALTDRKVIDRINDMRHSDDIEILNLAEVILTNIYDEHKRSIRSGEECNGQANDHMASSPDCKDGQPGVNR